jgi:hypothetical protein
MDDTVVKELINWLEMQNSYIISGISKTRFDAIKVPANITWLLYMERLINLWLIIINSVGKTGQMCDLMAENLSRKNQNIIEYCRANLNREVSMRHVVYHKYIIINVIDRKLGVRHLSQHHFYNGNFIAKTSGYTTGNLHELVNTCMNDVTFSHMSTMLPLHGPVEIPGMLMSLSDHRIHGTAVWKAFASRSAKLKLQMETSLNKTVWVSRQTATAFRERLKSEKPKLSITHHNLDSGGTVMEVLTALLIQKYGSQKTDANVGAILVHSYVPAIHNKHYIKLISDYDNGKPNVHHSYDNMAITQIAKFSQSVDDTISDSEAYNIGKAQITHTSSTQYDRFLMDTTILTLTCDQIRSIVDHTAEKALIAIVPNFSLKQPMYFHHTYMYSRHLYIPMGETEATICVGDTIHSLRSTRVLGTCTDGTLLICDVLDRSLDHEIIQIRTVQRNVVYTHIDSSTVFGDQCEIVLPWIYTSLQSIMSSGNLLTTRRFVVKPSVVRLLLHRCNVGEDKTISGVLAYARTLALTYDTSESSIRTRYTFDMATFVGSAYAAFYYHNNYSQKFRTLGKIWDQIASLPAAVRIQVITMFQSIMSNLSVIAETLESKLPDININELLQVRRLGIVEKLISQANEQFKIYIDGRTHNFLITHTEWKGSEDLHSSNPPSPPSSHGGFDESDDDENFEDQRDESSNRSQDSRTAVGGNSSSQHEGTHNHTTDTHTAALRETSVVDDEVNAQNLKTVEVTELDHTTQIGTSPSRRRPTINMSQSELGSLKIANVITSKQTTPTGEVIENVTTRLSSAIPVVTPELPSEPKTQPTLALATYVARPIKPSVITSIVDDDKSCFISTH